MASKYSKFSDEELIHIIRTGDHMAMEYLITKYKNLVRKKSNAYFIIGGDKDDLIQEGMIGLFKAIREFDHNKDAKFITFADLCIARQIFTAVRASNRLKHLPLNSYISLNKAAYPDDDENTEMGDLIMLDKLENPEDLVISKENLERIERELQQDLSDFEREVLFLYLEGQGYARISEIMGKQAKSIDNALQRIKRKVNLIIKKIS